MQIDVALDVYKALTARLQYDGQTHSDVIRELLELDSPIESEPPRPATPFTDALFESKGLANMLGYTGFYSRGLNLPNGTRLRARYKNKIHQGVIENDEWRDEQGRPHSSPSSAASAITGTTVNGLRFWEALKPGDENWRRLDSLIAR